MLTFICTCIMKLMLRPSGRPSPESNTDVVSADLMKRVHGKATLFADGAKAWKTLAKTKGLKFAEVSHRRMQKGSTAGPARKLRERKGK